MLVLHLLLEWKAHRLCTHLEHLVGLLFDTMVLQAVLRGIVRRKIKQTETIHLLPEAESSRCCPELLNLVFVTRLEQLVVNDEEGVSWDIVWEGRIVEKSWHIVVLAVSDSSGDS